MIECRECRKLFKPKDAEHEFCDRHCARTFQARRGVPSQEDKEATFANGVMKLFHDIFRPKE
jgi:hypothetical protein